MNDSTAHAILQAARQLFAERGYRGSSVRAITGAAGANLGAVTYHFGSKSRLREAVLDEVTSSIRHRVHRAADAPAAPLDRLERVVRALLDHLLTHPDTPRLVLQELATGTELPPPIATTMRSNIGLIADLIATGQRDGSIRAGDPQLLALGVGAQPILLGLLRRALSQAVGLDQDDPVRQQQLIDSVVTFVRRGLAPDGTDP